MHWAMLLYTSNFSWGDKLCIVSLNGPCVWFCTFQLHWNSSNLDTAQDMYKFIDKMSIGDGLQGLTSWAASLWNLLGLRARLQFGQSPCNPVMNGTYIYLLTSMHWVQTSPLFSCMWFKNTRFNKHNATKFITLSTFHGHFSFTRRE